MDIFKTLGFHWDRSVLPDNVPVSSVEQVSFVFYKMLPQFVWIDGVLEGNPFTFPEVKTLLDGITVGGRKISDQNQILNISKSTHKLLELVKTGQFSLTKSIFTELNKIVACEESFEWGVFRGEGKEKSINTGVNLGEYGRYMPIKTEAGAPVLNQLFIDGIEAIKGLNNPLERALIFYHFGALQQFFFDGNKRTSRLMMNGELMAHGIDAINIPAQRVNEFNAEMVNFYVSKDATNMINFMLSCR